MRLIAADIGGTHARFAVATIQAGSVLSMEEDRTFKTADFSTLQSAWRYYRAGLTGRPPRHAALAVAAPVGAERIHFTNNPWVLSPRTLNDELEIDSHILLNDFAAIGHAIAHAEASDLQHLAGPPGDLPARGIISVIGPGTGLGVAYVALDGVGYSVHETEGGHIAYAPNDLVEDQIVADLRRRFQRVSAERVVSGSGLLDIYRTLARLERAPMPKCDATTLWASALDASGGLEARAVERFCGALGSVAGDLVLAQGASAAVIAGGLGFRLRHRLPRSPFGSRFADKGRFQEAMSQVPVKVIVRREPGLFGAAAAFAQHEATANKVPQVGVSY
jgi:glucokinase